MSIKNLAIKENFTDLAAAAVTVQLLIILTWVTFNQVFSSNKSAVPQIKRTLNLTEDSRLQEHTVLQQEAFSISPHIIEQERTVSGIIKHSFAAAARDLSLPYAVVDNVVDLFSSRIDFRSNIQPGDRFTVIYMERRREDGTLQRPGKVRAACFQNMNKIMSAVLYPGPSEKDHYYDENGQPLENFFLRYPVEFSRISSIFSDSRLHPILRIRRPHYGIDLAARVGTPVRSVADGVVTSVRYDRAAGRIIKVRHSSRYSTAYLHLHNFSKGITKGARVKRGQIIGTVGSTGLSTGPHLDYRLIKDGRYVNPLKVQLPKLPRTAQAIPSGYLSSMLQKLKLSLKKV